jgi:hypothetical protein
LRLRQPRFGIAGQPTGSWPRADEFFQRHLGGQGKETLQ